jgi:hypothetical protein
MNEHIAGDDIPVSGETSAQTEIIVLETTYFEPFIETPYLFH